MIVYTYVLDKLNCHYTLILIFTNRGGLDHDNQQKLDSLKDIKY